MGYVGIVCPEYVYVPRSVTLSSFLAVSVCFVASPLLHIFLCPYLSAYLYLSVSLSAEGPRVGSLGGSAVRLASLACIVSRKELRSTG